MRKANAYAQHVGRYMRAHRGQATWPALMRQAAAEWRGRTRSNPDMDTLLKYGLILGGGYLFVTKVLPQMQPKV